MKRCVAQDHVEAPTEAPVPHGLYSASEGTPCCLHLHEADFRMKEEMGKKGLAACKWEMHP